MTDRNDITGRVMQLTARLLSVDGQSRLTRDATLREAVGLDSMGLISLMFLIEQEFAVDLTSHANSLNDGVTIADVAAMISEAMA